MDHVKCGVSEATFNELARMALSDPYVRAALARVQDGQPPAEAFANVMILLARELRHAMDSLSTAHEYRAVAVLSMANAHRDKPPTDRPDNGAERAARRAVAGERAVFEFEGVRLAVVPAEDVARLQELEAAEDRLDLELAREREDEPTAAWEDARARLGDGRR